MKWMKWNILALSMGVLFVLGATYVSGATVSSNVALFQPVTVQSGVWESEMEEWPPLSVMTDDVEGTRLLCDSELSGLWINLQAEYDITKVYLSQKTNLAVAGAKLHAFAADQVTEVGTVFTVPKSSNYSYTMSDWNGVQWILIADEGGTPTIMTDSLREIRVYSQVETWTGTIGTTSTNFIYDLTATASSTYPDAANVKPTSTCNSSGMTDQRGPVGDPDALSISSGPFWQPVANMTDASITYNFGKLYDLDEMYVWNLNQINHADRGIQHAVIEYSLDDITYTELADTNDTEAGNYTIPIVSENVQNAYSLAIDMTGIQAQYVRIHGLDSWGGTNIGLSEVRFYGEEVTEVPVPGDTDGDGDVDSADAAVLGNNWGRSGITAGASEGDFNGDQICNALDASILAANWGTGAGEKQSTNAVPEPATLTLLFSLLLVMGMVRPRRTA